tara:strand:+ start:6843 stop:7157 length:315 start_codon:yes stop_codon:yes gene_type:complete
MDEFRYLKSRFESMGNAIQGIVSDMEMVETHFAGPNTGTYHNTHSTSSSTSATSGAIGTHYDRFKESLLVQKKELAALLDALEVLQTATTGTLSIRAMMLFHLT